MPRPDPARDSARHVALHARNPCRQAARSARLGPNRLASSRLDLNRLGSARLAVRTRKSRVPTSVQTDEDMRGNYGHASRTAYLYTENVAAADD